MKIYQHIENLWSYMQLNHDLVPADCLFVMGSNDLRVAEHAVDLYHQGLARKVIFSGGEGRFTEGLFGESEAETFARIAIERGINRADIIIETRSTNSGENVCFTHDLLSDGNHDFKSFILVQKPFMERRALATFEKQWQSPYQSVQVSSCGTPFFDYINDEMTLIDVLHAVLGDFERIKSYPDKGFQTRQEVPESVEISYQYLIKRFPVE